MASTKVLYRGRVPVHLDARGRFRSFLGYSIFIFGWSIIYTWVFNNTRGSVLLAALVHGAGNTWAAYLDNYRGDLGNLFALAGVTVAVAVIIVLLAGPENLSRRNERNVLEHEGGEPSRAQQPLEGAA